MPMTLWDDIAGQECQECDGPATHHYGNSVICCVCHGGHLIDPQDALLEHIKVLAPRLERWAQRAKFSKFQKKRKEEKI